MKGYIFDSSSRGSSLDSSTGSTSLDANIGASSGSSTESQRPAAPTTLPPNAQTLSLGPERVSVPELLFHPKDAGIAQVHIHLVYTISTCVTAFD